MNSLENFISGNNPSAVLEFAMPIVMIGLILFFLVLAIILGYHWRKYGVGRVKAAIFMWIYLIGGVILAGIMVTSKLSY